MSFTAQHYIQVAKIIRETTDWCSCCGEPISLSPLISRFAEMFAADNPLFNPGMFWDECQPLEEVKKNGV